MKKLLILLVALFPLTSHADVRIFACEPEWESLAREIGKERVTVKTATSAFTDPHHIRARPSLIAAIRQSDLVFCSGSDLEVGWLPILLEKAKPSVQIGQIGHLMAADYVTRLEVPTVIDRSHGDVHPGGNPHVHLNPHNLLIIAQELSKRLVKIDADHAGYYQKNLAAFASKWQKAISHWEAKAKSLQDLPIVVHHKNWVYLKDWLGLNIVAALEPKPGIPPSASHLEKLLVQLKDQPAKAIIHAAYEDESPSEWLSDKTAIPAIKLPYTVGGNDEAKDLYGLFDYTVNKLMEANK